MWSGWGSLLFSVFWFSFPALTGVSPAGFLRPDLFPVWVSPRFGGSGGG